MAAAPQIDDLYTFVGVVEQRVGRRLPAGSTFLGGQSMGGLVAALGALRCQERWAGLVVFSGAMGVVWTLVLRCVPRRAERPPTCKVVKQRVTGPRAQYALCVWEQHCSADVDTCCVCVLLLVCTGSRLPLATPWLP